MLKVSRLKQDKVLRSNKSIEVFLGLLIGIIFTMILSHHDFLICRHLSVYGLLDTVIVVRVYCARIAIYSIIELIQVL